MSDTGDGRRGGQLGAAQSWAAAGLVVLGGGGGGGSLHASAPPGGLQKPPLYPTQTHAQPTDAALPPSLPPLQPAVQPARPAAALHSLLLAQPVVHQKAVRRGTHAQPGAPLPLLWMTTPAPALLCGCRTPGARARQPHLQPLATACQPAAHLLHPWPPLAFLPAGTKRLALTGTAYRDRTGGAGWWRKEGGI